MPKPDPLTSVRDYIRRDMKKPTATGTTAEYLADQLTLPVHEVKQALQKLNLEGLVSHAQKEGRTRAVYFYRGREGYPNRSERRKTTQKQRDKNRDKQ